MTNKIFFYFFFIAQCILLQSQVDSRTIMTDKYFWLSNDNDFYFKTDQYYTNGINIGTYHPVFQKLPTKYLLLSGNSKSINFSGISLTQEMYTPTNISISDVQYNDRPYSGSLYLSLFSDARNPLKKRRIYTQLSLGIYGSKSGAEQTQKAIHKITPSPQPEGWDNQLNNGLLINYQLEYEQALFEQKNIMIALVGKGNLGTYKTNAGIGTSFRIGKYNNYFTNLPVHKESNWQLYGTFNSNIKYVLHDITLQGNYVFDNSQFSSIYQPIEKFVINTSIGLTTSFNQFLLEGKYNIISPEFQGGEVHKYFTLTLGIGF